MLLIFLFFLALLVLEVAGDQNRTTHDKTTHCFSETDTRLATVCGTFGACFVIVALWMLIIGKKEGNFSRIHTALVVVLLMKGALLFLEAVKLTINQTAKYSSIFDYLYWVICLLLLLFAGLSIVMRFRSIESKQSSQACIIFFLVVPVPFFVKALTKLLRIVAAIEETSLSKELTVLQIVHILFFAFVLVVVWSAIDVGDTKFPRNFLFFLGVHTCIHVSLFVVEDFCVPCKDKWRLLVEVTRQVLDLCFSVYTVFVFRPGKSIN